MGMYTYILNEDHSVTNKEGLKAWLADEDAPEYFDEIDLDEHEVNSYLAEKRYIEKEYHEDINLLAMVEVFNDRKIIGYWDRWYVMVLRDLAQFIEGYVELAHETYDDFVRIDFKGGEIFFSSGQIAFNNEQQPVEEYVPDVPNLPEKERVLRNL